MLPFMRLQAAKTIIPDVARSFFCIHSPCLVGMQPRNRPETASLYVSCLQVVWTNAAVCAMRACVHDVAMRCCKRQCGPLLN